MSCNGLDPINLSMFRGDGQQASKGCDISHGQSSTGVYFSWNEINPYDGILNLQPPDFTTLLTIMNGEGYLAEVVGRHGSIAHLQDTAFSTLLQFLNNLEQHIVQDNPYNELNMLLKVVGQKNGTHESATNENLVMDFLVLDIE